VQIYKHRQVGTLILFALGLGVALTATVLILVPPPVGRVVANVVLVSLLLCMFLFWALNVEVTTNELVVSFGPGVIRRRFRVEDILNARIVRNPWYYGWGIRLTPHGWLFNVSGFDAVELELRNDRKFRIGTDDPQQLLTALQQASQFAS
jgi:hypothetical protein